MAPGGLVFAEEFPFQVLLFQLGSLHRRLPSLLLLAGGRLLILRQLLTRIIWRGCGGSLLPANALLTPSKNKLLGIARRLNGYDYKVVRIPF
jgi:hypothetical protein